MFHATYKSMGFFCLTLLISLVLTNMDNNFMIIHRFWANYYEITICSTLLTDAIFPKFIWFFLSATFLNSFCHKHQYFCMHKDFKSMLNPMWICFDNQEFSSMMPLCFHFLRKHWFDLNPFVGPAQSIISNRPGLFIMSNKRDGYSSSWTHDDTALFPLYYILKYQELSINIKL